CTITHPTTKEFYDLRGLSRFPDEQHAVDWHANPYDYGPAKGGNFSLNVCAPLIRSTQKLSKSQNISAMYTDEDEKMVSLGQTSTTLKFRGKKLILEYTGGSACPGDTSYKRSTLIVFTCDAAMVGTASVSYLGEVNDCGFVFEYRTFRACATTPDVSSALSPGVVFAIILGVALLVYMVGGCMYNRTVLHQAGWRQVPHADLWQSMGVWMQD
ncbi:mannose-6-phosphate receptor binding domain-containing protein, partial [Protomyces lactucae-debilis]